MYCGREVARRVGFQNIAQINRTLTRAIGVVRGMHFQMSPGAEAKLISCISGEIVDVIVDIRKGSETFLQSFTTVLSADRDVSLFVPRGFAHGFQTLKPETELIYMHDNYYDRDLERGLNALDPALKIHWPLQISQMSERDRAHPSVSDDFEGIEL